MKITPLAMLGASRIPALTSIFSDAITVSSMSVVASGLTTLTCASAHGVAIGSTQGVCIVDALTPNPIAAWELLSNGDVEITTLYEHDLTTTPDVVQYQATLPTGIPLASLYEPWDGFAIISGTGVVGLDGNKQLVSVDTRNTFVVRPGGTVTLPPTIPGGAAHMDRIERQLTGWHVATATTTTALTIQTPASVSRNYTVTSPSVVRNIRVWGAVDLEHALSHYSRDDEADMPVPGQGHMFICPISQARLSRDSSSRSDATLEIQPGQVIRQRLIDGFEIYAILPSERSGGAVACMDKAHGAVLRAVMRTFNGLRMPYTEFALPDPFITMMTGHGTARYTKANYVHQYTFEAVVTISNADCAAAIDMPDMHDYDAAILDGTTPPTSVQPYGSVPFAQVSFVPDPYGITHADQPQPLTAVVTLAPE